jgi:hypothetical protein
MLFFKKKADTYLFQPSIRVDTTSINEESPIFVVGVGRSGTHFLAELFKMIPTLNAYHLDQIGNSVADSFLMYCNWHKLPMDYTGFFSSRNQLIQNAKSCNARYLESNPYLSLFIKELKEYYPKSKILVVLRNPENVVLSHYNKGWYRDYSPDFNDFDKLPFYQYSIEKGNHFFGRIFPKTESEFQDWNELSQVGKITWMLVTINNWICESIKDLVDTDVTVLPIEHLDYEKYLSLSDFLNISKKIDKNVFEDIKNKRPGKTKVYKLKSWDTLAENDFQKQMESLNQDFRQFYAR